MQPVNEPTDTSQVAIDALKATQTSVPDSAEIPSSSAPLENTVPQSDFGAIDFPNMNPFKVRN